MDEAITDFMNSLEELVSKAQVVQGLIEDGNVEASGNDLESFSSQLDEQLAQLGELQDALNSELNSMPLDFDGI